MPDLGARPSASALASTDWDVIVVGGGITGAGIARETARLGAHVLLIERGDFASGTSSRSSKLVHGGLHYLARLELGLARMAGRERERLLMAGGNLVRPLPFILPMARSPALRRWKTRIGLAAYGLVGGGSVRPRWIDRGTLDHWLPGLDPAAADGFVYHDAVTDDAALVLRVLREACDLGAVAINYVEATRLLRGVDGRTVGIALRDLCTGASASVRARVVINAAGAWCDGLRGHLGLHRRIRWVRGSHLVLARPISHEHAVATLHPASQRPLYLIPWGGRTLVGSTHVEDDAIHGSERITDDEADYLADGLRSLFPGHRVRSEDVISTFTGVRPIIDRGAEDPARASRAHAVWEEEGLFTVTGGKLTTFQSMAFDVLDRLTHVLPGIPAPRRDIPPLAPLEALPADLGLDMTGARRIQHRHGTAAVLDIARAVGADRLPVGPLAFSGAQLRWILRHEAVVHLDDLLLRRLRIGLTSRNGGMDLLDELRPTVQDALGWSDARWHDEADAYRRLWRRCHAPPWCPAEPESTVGV